MRNAAVASAILGTGASAYVTLIDIPSLYAHCANQMRGLRTHLCRGGKGQTSNSYHQLWRELWTGAALAPAPASPGQQPMLPMPPSQQQQTWAAAAAVPGVVADKAAAAAAADSAGPSHQRPSRVLLRFHQELASGGSGGLVMAGTCDGADCVIKLLGPDRRGLAAYEREVAAYAALKGLQGLHVPKLLAWGDLDYGVRFLALRRVAGAQSLSCLPRPLPAAVATAALRALDEVQAACPSFVHGDVRLSNVVLAEAAEAAVVQEQQQHVAGPPSSLQHAGAAAGAGDGAGGSLEARAAGGGQPQAAARPPQLPRCALLDFGRSRLDGDPAQQQRERKELDQLLQQ